MDLADFCDELKSVAWAASKDKTRVGLGGVCVAISDCVLSFVATDGYLLAKRDVRRVVGPCSNVLWNWPASVVDRVLKLKPRKGVVGRITINLQCRSINIDGMIFPRFESEAFPPYKEVIPVDRLLQFARASIAPVYMMRACKAFADIGAEHVKLWYGESDLHPIVIESEGSDLLVVVMPRRV